MQLARDAAAALPDLVMSTEELKSMPIFDDDYVTAMGSFLDPGQGMTGGTGLMVDGVEANRALVSPSAVEEVHINQDPYSAQYYRPGRGQMEIVTKQAADAYHGQLNFMFRDAAMNAQQDFAPNKPAEQRRIYEGSVTGPLWHAKKSSFSRSRCQRRLSVVSERRTRVAPSRVLINIKSRMALSRASGICGDGFPFIILSHYIEA